MRNAFDRPAYPLQSDSMMFIFGRRRNKNHQSHESQSVRNWTIVLTFGSIFMAVLSALSAGLVIAMLE